MDTTELQELIGDMPLTEEDKKDIAARQASGAQEADVLKMISEKLDEIERELMQSTPEGAAVYQEAVDAFSKEVNDANNEFEQKMGEIEQKAGNLDKEINKEIDAARMQELTEERNAIPG